MTQIAVIDYDMGNLHSACKGLEHAGVVPVVTHDPIAIAAADGIVLPGVGAFDPAVRKLRDRGLEMPIKAAIDAGKPFLGICLGMQILLECSEEGSEPGLGIVPGTVRRFRSEPGLAIPHMGWNRLEFCQPDNLLWQNMASYPWMYFVHSYYADPQDLSVTAAWTNHGSQRVTAAIARLNLMAVQFHPEKSATEGLQLLANFASFVRSTRKEMIKVDTIKV